MTPAMDAFDLAPAADVVEVEVVDAAPAARSATGFARRAVWSFAGQAVSSGSNFLLGVLVLAVAPPAEFATFSL